MKKSLCHIAILFSIFLNAQEKNENSSILSINPFNEIQISFRDGTTLEGLGRINLNEEIIYKADENADKTIYDFKKVSKLTLKIDGAINIYEYKIVEGSGGVSSVKLISPILIGKANLYQDYSTGSTYGQKMSGGYGFSNYSKTTYYISKNGEDTVINLRIGNTYSNRFKEIAEKLFSDCPDILIKIKTQHFNRYGIKSVVEYYNEECK